MACSECEEEALARRSREQGRRAPWAGVSDGWVHPGSCHIGVVLTNIFIFFGLLRILSDCRAGSHATKFSGPVSIELKDFFLFFMVKTVLLFFLYPKNIAILSCFASYGCYKFLLRPYRHLTLRAAKWVGWQLGSLAPQFNNHAEIK